MLCDERLRSCQRWLILFSFRSQKKRMSSIGVFASLFDSSGRILLVRQAYGSCHWTTPGGRAEVGESPLAALKREVIEEIACELHVKHPIGGYAKPYRDDPVLSSAADLARSTPPTLP